MASLAGTVQRAMVRAMSRSLPALCLTFTLARLGHAQSNVPPARGGPVLVENGALLSAPARYRLAPTPTFDVGGLEQDPELEFNARRGELWAVPLRSGGLAVLDVTRVHVFSSTGARLRVVGRDGSGPNEFRGIYAGCGLAGDTLLVADGSLSRLSVISPGGGFARTMQSDDARAVGHHACLDDGTVLVARTLERRGPRSVVEVVRLDARGRRLNSVTRENDAPSLDFVAGRGLGVIARGSLAYVGDGREIRVYRADGVLVRRVRTRDPVQPITDAEYEQEFAFTFPKGTSAAERTRVFERAKARRGSTVWPLFDRVIPGDDGRVWVQHFRRSSERLAGGPFARERWTAFDSLGRLDGRLELPPLVRRDRRPPDVIAFPPGGVLLKEYDDDGAVHFRRYELLRAR